MSGLKKPSPLVAALLGALGCLTLVGLVALVFLVGGGSDRADASRSSGGFSVADEVISREDIDRQMAALRPPAGSGVAPNEDLLRQQAATFLGVEAMLRLEAEARDIDISDELIDQTLTSDFGLDPAKATEAQRAQALVAARQIAMQKALLAETPADLSDAALRAWFDKNRERLTQPRYREVRVFRSSARGPAQAVARQFSQTPAETPEGAAPEVIRDGVYSADLVKRIFEAPTGSVIGPEKVGNQWLTIAADGTLIAAVRPSFSEAKEQIIQIIETEAAQALYADFMNDLRPKWEPEVVDPEDLLPAPVAAPVNEGATGGSPTGTVGLPPVAPPPAG